MFVHIALAMHMEVAFYEQEREDYVADAAWQPDGDEKN